MPRDIAVLAEYSAKTIPCDTYEEPPDTISARQLEQILKVVEEVFRHHTQWHDDLIRQLLCCLPVPTSMMAKGAQRYGAVGIWFYGIG
jgi:hypothetical protein